MACFFLFFIGLTLHAQNLKTIGGISFSPVTLFEDGSTMSDNKVDGVIYKKIGQVYYKRVYSGSIKSSWFGAAGDGITDDSKALQKALDWCVANHKDLEIDGNHLVETPLVINRKVDAREFARYFVIFSNSGGGFTTKTPILIFTTTIPFDGKPVSQLVNFRDLNFTSLNPADSSYVLDGSKFLRIQFMNCSFIGIKLLFAIKYIQTIYLSNCNIRYWQGDFLKSLATAYDVRMLGCIAEHGRGTCLYLSAPSGCSVHSSLIEGVSGSAISINGARGLSISGNYFEGNKEADINMTVGGNSVGGLAITGNFFANTNKQGNLYSILWTKSAVTGAISHGNYANTNLHYFYDKIKADIKDSASTELPILMYTGLRGWRRILFHNLKMKNYDTGFNLFFMGRYLPGSIGADRLCYL